MLNSITSWFKDLFENIWNSFVETLEALILTIFDMLKDFFFFIIDTLMGWGISLLDTITAPLSVFSPQQYINLIPADMLNVMGLIGLGDAMAIIVAALLIRLTMQLIPFVRLGS